MTHNEAITAPETSPQLVSIPPQVIQAAAIASAGGAVEWNLLSARAQLEAHADCEVIILAAFSALRQAGGHRMEAMSLRSRPSADSGLHWS